MFDLAALSTAEAVSPAMMCSFLIHQSTGFLCLVRLPELHDYLARIEN